MADADRCVGCGEIVVEGTMVCQTCLSGAADNLVDRAMDNLDKAQKSIQKALASLSLLKRSNSYV